MSGYVIDLILHVELNIIIWKFSNKYGWIQEIAWLKLHFNKKKRKHSFMKHGVLNDNI
jgi:hypothetical protein